VGDHAYWSEIKFDLYDAYRRYLQLCLSLDTRRTPGRSRWNHYKPKSKYPGKAYEWNNYRLMCGTLNGRKKDFEDVLDPFRVTNGMFVIEFPSWFVKPSANLGAGRAKQVRATIE